MPRIPLASMAFRSRAGTGRSRALRVGRVLLATIAACVALLCFCAPAIAHQFGLSTIELRVGDVTVDIVLAADLGHLDEATGLDDVERFGAGEVSEAELMAGEAAIADYVSRRLQLSTGDEPCPMELVELRYDAARTAGIVWMRATCPDVLGPLDVVNRVFVEQPGNHRTIGVVIEGDRRFRVSTDREAPTFRYEATPPDGDEVAQSDRRVQRETTATLIGNWLWLGVEHIVLGPDHVLFLLTLLVVARRLRTLVTLVTGFTVAHSLTLGLAALDIASPPAWIVEPVIALSILVVGVENVLRERSRRAELEGDPPARRMLRPDAPGRLGVVFGFGLVHGFGFAGVVAALGLPSGEELLALGSFNVGVELGQLALILATWPLLWWTCRNRPVLWTRVAQALSVVASIAGAAWLIQRVVWG